MEIFTTTTMGGTRIVINLALVENIYEQSLSGKAVFVMSGGERSFETNEDFDAVVLYLLDIAADRAGN